MQEHVRESLYGAILDIGEDRVISGMRQGESRKTIDEILDAATGRLGSDTMPDEMASLATGLLHYVLTVGAIPSQRKVEYGGIRIDIVVPDLKTLKADPRRALVINVWNGAAVPDLSRVQPRRENVWHVVPHRGTGRNEFVIGENYSGIADAIRDFLGDSGVRRLRILGA